MNIRQTPITKMKWIAETGKTSLILGQNEECVGEEVKEKLLIKMDLQREFGRVCPHVLKTTQALPGTAGVSPANVEGWCYFDLSEVVT